LTIAGRVRGLVSAATGQYGQASATFKVNAGDIIRAHTNGNADFTTDEVQFTIQEMYRF